jgi:hypothetical protein
MARDYTTLITSEHAGKPKFAAMVALVAGCFGDAADVATAMRGYFDLDDAVGAQLDVVGEWIGLGRYVTTPITGAYFSFGVEGVGWGEGYWLPPYAPTEGLTRLDDDTYRTMLRGKIAANHYDGTLPSYQTALAYIVSGTSVDAWAIDNQDMTLTVRLFGTISPVLVTLLKNGTMPAKPFGVLLGVESIGAIGTEDLLCIGDSSGTAIGTAPTVL